MTLRESLASGSRLLLDGGFGTMVQARHLAEQHYRATRFTSLPGKQQGNNDLLCLSRPDIVADIHRAYLDAGAHIITTNTFNAQRISLADYGCRHLVREINLEGARLARRMADERGQRFVAGSVGPTNKTLSISPSVEDPAARALSFDELADAYREQMAALIEGGVDALLIETVFDTLNAKAALYAAQAAMRDAGRTVELMVSATVSDRSGRTLSGQTIRAFVASVAHAPLLSIGLNCGFGARQMLPALQELSACCPFFVSAHPNAGLPNAAGEYDESPAQMAEDCKALLPLTNIIGGCCGTTPAHIAALATLLPDAGECRKPVPPSHLTLSGLEPLDYVPGKEAAAPFGFVAVGERCNVAGSRKFLRLIKEKNYDEAIQIACSQVRKGAMVIDVNLDDALLDAKAEMRHFLNLLAAEPDAARVPVMIDSSQWDVILEGLKCLQGKGIVNSLSLKEGEEAFLRKARECHALGAAIVVMLFDERGQATDYERRIGIASRAYRLLTTQAGIPPHDIIFDPNVLAVATGMTEHNAYAADFIRAVAWMRQNLPGVQISGGISNLSFSFRGNNPVREAMHAAFLHHACAAGMNMAIVNAATRMPYNDIPTPLLTAIEDVLLFRRDDATERLLAIISQTSDNISEATKDAAPSQPASDTAIPPLHERLKTALINGDSTHLDTDLHEALAAYPTPASIIDGPLMDGMRHVGELFGEGKMFLPQVVKTARTMKRAVAILQPFIEQSASQSSQTSGSRQPKVLIATVKGDVHDIGKNIVSVVMACGGYAITDLGVMVPPETIVAEALRLQPDIIALSGLITPSLSEMVATVSALKEAGVTCPVMIGGATTSRLHTALKIAPAYDGPVLWVQDAAQNTPLANRFLSPQSRDEAFAALRDEQARLRHEHQNASKNKTLTPIEEARRLKPTFFDTNVNKPTEN